MREKFYKIENLIDPTLPKDEEEFKRLLNSKEVRKALDLAQESYVPWQDFKYKTWVSDDLKEKTWGLIKAYRRINGESIPIKDENNNYYSFNPRSYVQFLHEIDLELGGNFMGIEDFSEADKRGFIRRNLIEESIASSQLEGANTSRKAAKELLNQGRKPKDKSEQMIVNNHETMCLIEQELKNEELSIDTIFELHRRITHETINKDHQGVLRETYDKNGKPLVIKPWDDETIAYEAPSKGFVEKELLCLIDFANDKLEKRFIHPLIKAIMLHFWIGILHPFEDGNGRLARIIFYWYMLRKGYWAFSYISLSEKIVKSAKQYSLAYIYSEQDGYDLNYFISYNINKLKLARKHLRDYIERKIVENRKAANLLRKGYNFNDRQFKLLQYLAKDEQRFTNLTSYHNINNDIGKVTATADLKKLVDDGFLEKLRRGRNIFYYPTDKIKEIFKK